ncbi:MAG: alpha/beta fold hydrolase [Verrucomicrobiota bacterium]
MDIILVHGIWDTGRIFSKMATALEAAGHRCHTPSLVPANAANGLADLAEKLQASIEASIQADQKFALVGFSMGSVISRYYLQKLEGHRRASHFFSISGPHKGTLTAHLYLGKGPRDMRFGSRLLRGLNEDLTTLSEIELHTYRTPFDLMILPSRSSVLSGASNHTAHAKFHHLMVSQSEIHEHIIQTLQA